MYDRLIPAVCVILACFAYHVDAHGSDTTQRELIASAIKLNDASLFNDAIRNLQKAISRNPESYEASHALFLLSRCQADSGDRKAAQETIIQMETQWPDSAWTLHAKKLAASITNNKELEKQTELLIQKNGKAAKKFDSGVALYKNGNTKDAIAILRQVIAAAPETPAALQAKQSIGNILAKDGDTTGSKIVFEGIVRDWEPFAPNSQMVELAQRRLAALEHRLGNRELSLQIYTSLVGSVNNPQIAATSGLQASGLLFELLLRDLRRGKPVDDSRYDEVRAACEATCEMDGSTSDTQARANLMTIEMFEWQANYPKIIQLGNQYIREFGEKNDQYSKELASARIICAAAYIKENKPVIAVPLLNQVLADYVGENEIWPGMDHLQRVYLLKWRALRNMNSDRKSLQQVKMELKKRFPDSKYNDYLDIETKQLPK